MSQDGSSPDETRAASDLRKVLSVAPAVDGPAMHTILDERRRASRSATSEIGPGQATLVDLPKGAFLRVLVLQQPQVGEVRFWDRNDLNRRFSPEVTRRRVGAHLELGDQLVTAEESPVVLATVSGDSIQWYGYDTAGAGVNDLLGSPCDQRTSPLVADVDETATCRGSVAVALAQATGGTPGDMYPFVGDGLGLFVCSGVDERGDYFTCPTPARGGDYLEFYAQRDLLVCVSGCPVGDGTETGDTSRAGRLRIDIISPDS